MKPITVLAVSLVALSLSACATPYQQIGTTIEGGYSTSRLSTEIFEVRFSGNGFTDPKRAYDFAFLRAAEVALEYNFPYFELLGHQDDTSTEILQTAPTSYTTGAVNTYGGSGAYSSTTTTYRNDIPVMKPSLSLRILGLESPDSLGKHAGKIYVAEDVKQELRQKYKLNQP
jgi:hypothetical protein